VSENGSAGGVPEPFRHRLRVRYSECDPQGHVFNARYLEYFDIGMTEIWRETIGPYDAAMDASGVDMVVAEASIRYFASLQFDQEFDLELLVTHMGTTSMVTSIAIVDVEGNRSAEGEIRHVFIEKGSARKTPIPGDVRAALAPYATA
jgi:acyl-CoA thioester hydrolase